MIAREMTKLFETITAGSLEKIILWVRSDANQQKGEMVVIAEGKNNVSIEGDPEAQRILTLLLDELPLKQSVELAAKITGQKKNDIYDMALKIKNKSV